jgi:hypothetical protein
MLNTTQSNCFNSILQSFGLITVCALISAPSFAVTPSAQLENAQVYATGNKFQAFRVPTVDANGKVQYYDLSVDLNVLSNGKINPVSAVIKSALSPNTLSNKFIPGIYSDGNGATCTVVTAVLQGGRTEAAMSCKYANGYNLQANWITGLIPGHPFELDLKTAKINLVPAYSNYSWGKVANSTNFYFWGCIIANGILSVRQIGNTLSLGGYGAGNKQLCGVNMTKK